MGFSFGRIFYQKEFGVEFRALFLLVVADAPEFANRRAQPFAENPDGCLNDRVLQFLRERAREFVEVDLCRSLRDGLLDRTFGDFCCDDRCDCMLSFVPSKSSFDSL